MIQESSLRKKGWTDREIQHAKDIMNSAKHDVHFSKMVFWAVVLVIIIGNLFIAVGVIPLLLALNRLFFDIIIIILGLLLGYIYTFLVTDIGHLERHHHIAAGILILGITLLNTLAITFIADIMLPVFQIDNPRQSPWVIGIIYAISFAIPFTVKELRK